MKRVLLALLIIIGGLLGVFYFGSGTVAEKAARNWLDQQGIAYKNVSISNANLRSAGISNITLGKGDNITLEGAHIAYNVKGKDVALRSITAKAITIDTAAANGSWDLGGLESKLGMEPFNGPDAPRIHIAGRLSAEQTTHGMQGKLEEGTFSYTQGAMVVSADVTSATLTPSETQGEFAIAIEAKNVKVTNDGEAWTAPLTLSATATMAGKLTTAQGRLSDEGGKLPLILSGKYDGATEKGTVQWTSERIVFAPGALQPTVLSPMLEKLPPLDATLTMQGNLRFDAKTKPKLLQNFIIERAALSPLLKLVFKDDISVTGDLAGTIPVTWAGEKIAQVKNAKLKNTAPGTLIYDPITGASSALEGQDKAGLLLEALRKFNYNTLTINASSDSAGQLKATFNIKGNNPDFYNGKLVDFTLNVTGNVLSLLETNQKVNNIIHTQ